MNKRGFTMIELLAVIVIMSIVLVIAIPTSMNAYKQSKLKAEEGFINRLSESIDSYMSLSTLENNQILMSSIGKKIKEDSGSQIEVTVYKREISFNDIFKENIMSPNDFINPNNKETECDAINEIIEVYRDSDYVFCHKVKAENLKCLSNEYINKYLNNNSNSYVIDTCVWKEKKEEGD